MSESAGRRDYLVLMSRTIRTAGLVVTDHEVEVPLDHDSPGGPTIDVFAREVADPEGTERPLLVFLQGGPGQEAPRPSRRPLTPAWLDRALRDFRVVMLDQRGTGLSSPVGTPSDGTPAEWASYLTHFRADSIVRDAELVRRHLGADRWSVLGQSFGGFCALAYLSMAPDSLREVFFTGGLPPVGRGVDEVYARTYETLRRKGTDYYRRYPDDRKRFERLLEACDAGRVRLPNGDVVTPRLLRTIGNRLGMDGGAEQVHYLLERDAASSALAHDLAGALPFNDRNPLYAVIHESSYADGGATRWSAERMQPEAFRADPTLFTGEHVFPWHFEDCSALAGFREVAHLLAEHEWPRLYDAEVLAATDVRCAAAIYADDAFVDRAFSEQTAALLPGMRTWLTNEYEHNGLRVAGDVVLDRLIGLARGTLS